MRDRLDRLGTDACQVVRVAAVLGQRFTAEELAAVLDRRPSQLLEPIDEAVRVDMLTETGDRLSFRHELLRQAVLGTLPLSLRRSLQREVATALVEHGASAVHVAAQVAESALPGDAWAVGQLRAAARELSSTDAEAAADMSVRALELCPPDGPERGALLIETLELLHNALRDDEADALAAEALEGALTPEQQAAVRLTLSTRFSRPGHERAEENRRALRLSGLSARMRARHHGWLACTLANAGQIDEAHEHAEQAIAVAGDDDGSGRALGLLAQSTIALRRGEYAAALAKLDTIDGDGEPPLPCLVELRRAEALGLLGRLDEAMVLLGDNLQRQRRERRPSLEGAWLALGAQLRFMAGAFDEALADAEAAEALGFPFTATPGGAGAVLSRLEIAVHTGDAGQRRAALGAAQRIEPEGGPVAHWHRSWVFALTSGEVHEAVRRLDASAALLPRDPAYLPHLARLALAAGNAGLARRAVAAADAIERANPGVPLLTGLAAHARGLVTGDARSLGRAADLLAGTQRPLTAASALEDAGRVLGDVERLGSAFEGYSRLGASTDAKRVAGRLREHGVRLRIGRPAPPAPAQGWDSLTESELRVVRLVGAGASNRRAAERLHLSPHTVSTHLRHAFAKLQINSRVELARLLHEHDVPAYAR
jgi:DNA-binding CsgD family transcriptional regulator/tetratricopeptide (TPR) repeat protein